MNDYAQIEKKNSRIGVAISIGIHVILLLLFLWFTVWEEPYPPAPEFGIELNLGLTETGSGNEPVAEQPQENIQQVEQETVEESQEEVTEPADETVESPSEVEPVTESEDVAEETVTQTEEAPVKAAEKKTPPKKQEKAAEQKPVVAEKEPEKPKANPNALFPGTSTSQGEKGKTGDQGVEDGKVDAKNLMGPQGGGDGSQLDMAGWAWDKAPRPNDTSDQNGKIVFEIKVDSNGEVISVRLLETTVSPEVVKVYQNEVSKLSFSRTSGGAAPSQSSGKITFLIRSK